MEVYDQNEMLELLECFVVVKEMAILCFQTKAKGAQSGPFLPLGKIGQEVCENLVESQTQMDCMLRGNIGI
eukprot:3664610-Amphidinium_carterae.1